MRRAQRHGRSVAGRIADIRLVRPPLGDEERVVVVAYPDLDGERTFRTEADPRPAWRVGDPVPVLIDEAGRPRVRCWRQLYAFPLWALAVGAIMTCFACAAWQKVLERAIPSDPGVSTPAPPPGAGGASSGAADITPIATPPAADRSR